MQALLHVDELLDLALQHPAHRDTGPAADDLGDVLLIDLFLEEGAARALQLLELGAGLLQLLLEGDHLAVAQACGLLEVRGALGALGLVPCLFDLLLELAQAPDDLLLAVPPGAQRVALLLQRGQLLLEAGQPLARGLVALLLQRLPLDLQLPDLALDLVQLGGQGVDLHA